MFKFLLGALLGAAGYWFYRFWKGEDDTSWDMPYSTDTETFSAPSPPPPVSEAAPDASKPASGEPAS